MKLGKTDRWQKSCGSGKPNVQIICCLLLLIDALLALVLCFALNNGEKTEVRIRDVDACYSGEISGLTQDEQQEKFDQALGKALQRISLRSEAEASEGNIELFFNNTANSPCTVSLEIVFPETGETIARMGLVDPGWHVDRIPLLVNLEKGVYQCVARCSFYTGKNEVLMGTAGKMMLLTVK